MKRTIVSILSAAFIFAPLQRSASFPPPVGLCIFFKCTGITGLLGYAYFIYQCEAQWYLARSTKPGEAPFYFITQQNLQTLRKTAEDGEEIILCEGPSRDREDMQGRAALNNQTPSDPIFPCGPLGRGLPGPARTNLYTLQQSIDGGEYFTIATTEATEDCGASFVLLPPSGTNGFSKSALYEMRGATVIQNPTPSAKFAMFRRLPGEQEGAPSARLQDITPVVPLIAPLSETTHIVCDVPGQPGVSVIVAMSGYGYILLNGTVTGYFPPDTFNFEKLYNELVPSLSATCPDSTEGCVNVRLYKLPWLPTNHPLVTSDLSLAKWIYARAMEGRK